MKKTILSLFLLFIGFSFAIAGGIVTNTNQSAAWVRTLARDASVDVDAVFFNPAGLTHLKDGFHIQVNSQTIPQTRTITNDLATLNHKEFKGETFVPFLPTAYIAYKTGQWAFGAGFTVIGGGGTAEFEDGLPSFEAKVGSGVLTNFAALGVNKYDADIYFKGASTYLGFQGEIAYKINDMVSLAAGARYVKASNSYVGHIKDIKFNPGGGDELVNANQFLTQRAEALLPAIAGTDTIVVHGGGLLSFAGAEGLNVIDNPTRVALENALLASGFTQDSIDNMNIATANAIYKGTRTQLQAGAAGTVDQFVDVTQTGSAITPFFGADFSFMEGALGLSVKYELATKMTVKNATTKDDVGLYPDGKEISADMPSMLSIGVRYKADALRAQAGFHYYGDKSVKYGKTDDSGKEVTNGEEATIQGKKTSYLAGNSYEVALGLEYDLTDMFTLSGGFLMTKPNPNDVYQSDLSYTLGTKTFGFGAAVNLNENFKIDLGASFTSYDDYSKDTSYGAKETYDKVAKIFSIGLTYRMGGE